MTRYPVGPKQKSIGETSRDVSPPLLLNLALALNAIVLLIACFLMLFLHPQNLSFPFTPVEQAGIVLFGIFGSALAIWTISTARRYSRPVIVVNTLGVLALCLSFYFGRDLERQWLSATLLLTLACVPTLWVLYRHPAVCLLKRPGFAGDLFCLSWSPLFLPLRVLEIRLGSRSSDRNKLERSVDSHECFVRSYGKQFAVFRRAYADGRAGHT